MGRTNFGSCFLALMVCVILALPAAPAHAIRIKISTKAPANFGSAKIVTEMTEEIDQATGGEVQFKIYYGGVKGTGRDLLLKMQSGEIQGGEFTAGEVSTVCKDLRVLSIPLTLDSEEEVDYVLTKISPRFQRELKKAGYAVLGWLEVGFAYIMSTQPIASLADLKGKRVWIPEGDPVGQAAFESMGVPPIPMMIADVMVALQTGQINTVANSLVGAIALQWHTRIKYITDTPLIYVFGVLMITQEAYEQIPESHRATVQEIVDRHLGRLKMDIRKSNSESRQTLMNQGITFVPVSPAHYRELEEVVRKVNANLSNQQFPADALAEMQRYGDEYRKAHPEKEK
ncbi:MAG: TRAP transporter substrate-binding protein DctP [bacterium]